MMLYLLSFFLFLLINLPIYAASTVGLEIGNNLKIGQMFGNLSVECHYDYGDSYILHECRLPSFFPENYSHLIGPNAPELTRVNLVIKHNSDTPYVINGLHYKGKKSRTRFPFHLIKKDKTPVKACPLFSPILPLGLGENIVEYQFFNPKTGRELTGQFIINLEERAALECPMGRMYSTASSDCWRANEVRLCRQYFTNCRR